MGAVDVADMMSPYGFGKTLTVKYKEGRNWKTLPLGHPWAWGRVLGELNLLAPAPKATLGTDSRGPGLGRERAGDSLQVLPVLLCLAQVRISSNFGRSWL